MLTSKCLRQIKNIDFSPGETLSKAKHYYFNTESNVIEVIVIYKIFTLFLRSQNRFSTCSVNREKLRKNTRQKQATKVQISSSGYI